MLNNQKYAAVIWSAITYVTELKMGIPSCYFTFYSAEVYGCNTQVRSDIVLGNPLNDMRTVSQEVKVSLFWCIPDE